MAIDFPASPTLNQTFSVGNTNYVWDGTKWTASVTGGIALDKIQEGNTSAEVVDTGSDGRFVVNTDGQEALRVDASGRLGVGTIPSHRLHVAGGNFSGNTTIGCYGGTQSGDYGLVILGTGSTDKASINVDATNNDLRLDLRGNNGAFKFVSGAAYTERFRIADTGAIGLSGANYGTSGQVLTSQGSGAAPQWATPSGGSWQFISSVTASNSASVAFTSGFSADYGQYIVTCTNLASAPSQFSNIRARVSTDGGSTYLSGNSSYTVAGYFRSYLQITDEVQNYVRPDNIQMDFTLQLFSFSSSNNYKYMPSRWFSIYGAKEIHCYTENNTSAFNAIQFFLSAGNIYTGTFRLYGLKNS